MIITFKTIPDCKSNQWIGWFGENIIKVRLSAATLNAEQSLLEFIHKDLGINLEDMQILSRKNKGMVEIKFPDVAWELFLSIIEK
jgi:hypothetical protein